MKPEYRRIVAKFKGQCGKFKVYGLMAFFFSLLPSSFAADWPQLQCNAQRTGFTADDAPPPWEFAWIREFHEEKLAKSVQPVVYAGRVYAGTMAGNLRAMDAKTGEDAWKYETGSCVLHTAACGGGRVVWAALDGAVYALDASIGELVWKFEARAPGRPPLGFVSAPLIADGAVFIGNRSGWFYALDLETGALEWERDLGAPIFNTAAYTLDNAVVFGVEDMRVYCLEGGSGEIRWASEPLLGSQSFRDYHPVVAGPYVLVRPMRVLKSENWRMFNGLPWETVSVPEKAKPYYEELLALPPGEIPEFARKQEQELMAYHEANPWEQDLFCLNVADGKTPFMVPHVQGMTNPGAVFPPALDADGRIITPFNYLRVNLARVTLGPDAARIYDIIPTNPRIFNGPNIDETFNVSVGGTRIFYLHTMEGHHFFQGAFDTATRKWTPTADGYRNMPETQMLAPRWAVDVLENCGNAASIADGYFYHNSYNMIGARRTKQSAD